jgi:hypothetical protein
VVIGHHAGLPTGVKSLSTALTSSPPEVFISYSHKDEKLLKRLEVHLNVLERQKIITVWHGLRIPPGVNWQREIDRHLNSAEIILLLVSADFIASDYCFGVEFKRAMERHEMDAVPLIPVILGPCNWRDTRLVELNALPRGAKPLVNRSNKDEAFVGVIDEIKVIVKRLRPSPVSSVRKIEITLDDLRDSYDRNALEQRLYVNVAVDLKRITVSIVSGSIKIVIEGDSEELARIVNALRDPQLRKKILCTTNLQSITYIQDEQVQSISIRGPSLIDIFRKLIRSFRAVKYAYLFAVTAAAVTIVAVFLGHGPLQAYLYPNPTPSITPWPSPTAEASPVPTTTTQNPQIVVTERPPYDPKGDRNSKASIAGKVSGVRPQDYRIVIYSLTLLGTWYVQPTAASPKTPIGPDGSWRADIHSGMKYAILLVPPNFPAPATTSQSPTRLSGVITAEEIEGKR